MAVAGSERHRAREARSAGQPPPLSEAPSEEEDELEEEDDGEEAKGACLLGGGAKPAGPTRAARKLQAGTQDLPWSSVSRAAGRRARAGAEASRAQGMKDGDGDGEGDGEGDAFAEVQAWLDTVPLISVAPPKQVRAG